MPINILRAPPEDLSQWLFDWIQTSHLVCSNCFTPTLNDRIEPWSWKRHVRHCLRPVYLQGEGARDDRSYKNTPGGCDVCGVTFIHDTERPLPKWRAVEVARNLSAMLDQVAVDHSEEILINVVRGRKETPDLAGKDDENFQVALHEALAERKVAVTH